MVTEFALKHRPTSWDDVIGHKSVVLSLKKVLQKGRSRTFLFTGPSGVGKTTFARLVAKSVGVNSLHNIIEIDAAVLTGIDAMRDLLERLSYSTIDGTPRCVILDEVHAVSQQAFKSLLKSLEEPPPGVYWCLCTTEPNKIPKVIQTRAVRYDLKPVPEELIMDLLQRIKKEEKLRIAEEGLELITVSSGGSPRQALVYLAECGDFKNLSSIKEVLRRDDEESVEVIDLCRALLSQANGSNFKWSKIADMIRKLEVPAETARVVVLRYMNTVALSGGPKAMAALNVMSNFQQPFQDREGLAPLTMACAQVWQGEDE